MPERQNSDSGYADGTARDLGVAVDEVYVEIDYAILQHFSKHLYSSPNKAVEELVTNGYDALAHRVDVFLPGTWCKECLLVWDDGSSMDIEDLKRLWWIASSPKQLLGGDRIAESADKKTRRKMVGKFGIGKLASYAVGDQLTHLCRRGDNYLLVSVDYQKAPRLSDEPDRDRGFSTPIQRLDKATAESFISSLFEQEPDDLRQLLDRPTWTLAIVDSLREDVALTEGRLKWVLGNGMPLRPDFEVFVNGNLVSPNAVKASIVDWHMGTPEVQAALKVAWADAAQTDEKYSHAPVDDTSVPADAGEPSREDAAPGESPILFGVDTAADVDGGGDVANDSNLKPAREAYADLPGLGRVRARLRLFDTSLRSGRSADHGRSEGFFIFVKGRLINPDDSKLLLPDPSFGTFNRMQATIWADGLDDDLLADRERLQSTSETAGPLKLLQQTLYLVGRNALDKHDDALDQKAAPITSLPAESREFFRQPLTALALRHQAEGEPLLNLRRVRVDSAPASDAAPLMSIQPAENALILNTSHPLYMAVRRRVGDSRKGREALRLIELMALSDLLLEGHMLDLGVDEHVVEKLISWRSGQLRSIAVRYEKDPEQVIAEVFDASYPGKSRFEIALAQLFRLMGFVTTRDGNPGEKDVLVVAPLGADEFKFTIEAKGSQGPIENDSAEISGASNHAAKVGAKFALVVAREFKGFSRQNGSEPAILGECRTQNPPVAIATVETLEALYEALHANHYPLTTMVPLLEKIEPPEEKLAAVKELRRPVDKFDTRALLELCWDLQQGTNSGLPVSVLTLRSSRDSWKQMSKEAFDRVIFAVDALSGGLFTFQTDMYAVTMQQSPSIVAEAINSALEPATAEVAEEALVES